MYPELVIALATVAIAWRGTRLVTHDTLTEPLRNQGPQWWRTFLSCPYCVGFWIAIAAAASGWWAHAYAGDLTQSIYVWAGIACGTNLAWATLVATTATVGDRVNEWLDIQAAQHVNPSVEPPDEGYDDRPDNA